jgi:hypothetical protein
MAFGLRSNLIRLPQISQQNKAVAFFAIEPAAGPPTKLSQTATIKIAAIGNTTALERLKLLRINCLPTLEIDFFGFYKVTMDDSTNIVDRRMKKRSSVQQKRRLGNRPNRSIF